MAEFGVAVTGGRGGFPGEPTPYPDVNVLLGEVLAAHRATLGERLVGLYVFGSLALGAFDPDGSDVDLLAALATEPAEGDLSTLGRMLADLGADHPRWADRIEVGYLSVAALRAFGPQRRMARVSPGEPLHLVAAEYGWLFNLWVVRERGIVLAGPPPGTLIRPIAGKELRAALRPLAREWRAWVGETEAIRTAAYQAYTVVTMCRCLWTWEHGTLASKEEAVRWAEGALPAWAPLIRDAPPQRAATIEGRTVYGAGLAETLRFVRFATGVILDG